MNIKLLTLVFVAFPILTIYASFLPGLSIGELFLCIAFLFMTIRFRRLFQLPVGYKELFIYYIYGLSISVFSICLNSWIIGRDILYEFFSKTLFFILLLIPIHYVQRREFDYYLVLLSDFVVAFFYIQYVLSFFDIYVSGVLSFLPLSNEVDTGEFIQTQLSGGRCSAFFSEPAHYAEFLIIPLLVLMLGKEMKILKVFIYSFSILLTQSANGFVLVVFALLFTTYTKVKEFRNSNRYRILMPLLIIISIYTIIIIFPEFVNKMVLRFAEISFEGSQGSVNGSSSYIRVLRGYIPFSEYDVEAQFFGYGWGSLLSFINSHKTEYLSVISVLPDYVNSIQFILLTTGYVGLMIIGGSGYKLFSNNTPLGKASILTLLIMMFSTSVFFTYTTVYMVYLSYTEKYLNKCQNER